MITKTLSLAELEQLLDRCGANIATWPVEEQAALQMLLDGSAEARVRLEEARLLDTQLRAAQPKAPSGLLDRIMAASGARRGKDASSS